MRLPFILFFPQRYKSFWLRNKIPLSLSHLKFCVHFFLPSPFPTHAKKQWCLKSSNLWNLELKCWKCQGMSQDLFCQQKIWETLGQFNVECQKPGSYQAMSEDFKGCFVAEHCSLCCNSEASRTGWAYSQFCQDVLEGKEEGSAFSAYAMVNKKWRKF